MIEAMLLSYLAPFLLATSFLYFLHLFLNHNGMPWNWPLFGMTPTLLTSFHDMHNQITVFLERAGGTFLYRGIWFTNVDFLVTSDPENVRYVMNTNSSTYIKGSEWRKDYNSDFEAWKQNRKIFHAFLNHNEFHQSIAKIIPTQIEKGLIPLLKHVAEAEQVVDLQDLFVRHSFDLASIVVCGYSPKSLSIGLPSVPFSKAMDDAWKATFFRFVLPESMWKLKRWLQIGTEKKLRDAWKALDEILAEYIWMHRLQLKSGEHHDVDEGFNFLKCYLTGHEVTGPTPTDKLMRDNAIHMMQRQQLKSGEHHDVAEDFNFLKCYLTGHQVTGPTPTDKLMRDNALHMMLAIEDTSSTVLTWFFWNLSKNPHILNKIREELTRNLLLKEEGELRLPLNLKEMSKLVYLNAVLCETLRLFPPVPFEFRTATKRDTLPSGHVVNEKLKVMIFSYAMGRMRSIWGDDCHEFKPERWITAEGRIKREPPSKFFAFISGPRICLGKDFAFTLTKATVASIILNYKVEVVSGQNVTPKHSLILQMKYGLMVRIKRWN